MEESPGVTFKKAKRTRDAVHFISKIEGGGGNVQQVGFASSRIAGFVFCRRRRAGAARLDAVCSAQADGQKKREGRKTCARFTAEINK